MIESDDEPSGSAPWIVLKAGVRRGWRTAVRPLVPFHPGWTEPHPSSAAAGPELKVEHRSWSATALFQPESGKVFPFPVQSLFKLIPRVSLSN